jgi:hypothetical protein
MNYFIIMSLGIVLNGTVLSNSFAQTEPLGPLMSVTEFTIKPGHEMQFREGIKAWKACYLENNGDWTWRMWRRQQGEGSVFVLASDMANWAEMDKTDESGKKCRDLATSLINPHVDKATSHVNMNSEKPEYFNLRPDPKSKKPTDIPTQSRLVTASKSPVPSAWTMKVVPLL